MATCDERKAKLVSADVVLSLQTTRAIHAFLELKLLMKLFSCGYGKEKIKEAGRAFYLWGTVLPIVCPPSVSSYVAENSFRNSKILFSH